MEEKIRCPKCHCDKFSVVGDGVFKCAQCGTTYRANDGNNSNQAPKVIVTYSSANKTSARNGKSDNGRGCLIALAIVIGIPILLMLIYVIWSAAIVQ